MVVKFIPVFLFVLTFSLSVSLTPAVARQKVDLYDWAKKEATKDIVKISTNQIQSDLLSFLLLTPPLCKNGQVVYLNSILYLSKAVDAPLDTKIRYIQVGGHACKNAQGNLRLFSEPNFGTENGSLTWDQFSNQQYYWQQGKIIPLAEFLNSIKN